MIGILIATHANFGQGIINAVELIAGKQENVKAVGLNHGDGIEVFEQKIADSLKVLDQGAGVIVLCDFLGGSPANVVLNCLKKRKVPCLTGANMPMAIEAFMGRNTTNVWDLAAKSFEAGKTGILSLNDIAEKVSDKEDIDDCENF